MGINDNYVKALTKMASDPKNQEAYRQRVATIQADMQRVREQEVLADFNQWKADNGVVDVPQPKAPVMKSVDELRKPTREDNRKLVNDQRIKETLERKKNAKAINAARTVEQVNKNLANYVQKKQAENAVLKQNKGRDEYTRRQEERKQKLDAATPVTTPEQTKYSPVSNYLTGNSAPNNSFYNNTGVSVSMTADKKAKAVQQESVLVNDMNNAAEVDGVVNQWLAKDKLTGAEKKQAKKIYQQKKHALDLASSDWYRTMSTADATKKYNEELQKIEPLNLKSRGSMPFNYGLFKGLGTNSILKAEGDLLSKVTGDEGYKDAFNGVDTLSNMAQEENNVAYGAGNLTGELLKNAAEYGVANEVIGASRLGQAINNGAKKLPGGRFFGDAYANLATGQLADTLIDTPRTIAYNARDGKYIDENGNVDMGKVLADIGINQAVNLGFNAAFGIGDVVQGVKNKKASQKAFRDLLDTTTRNTPEAVAREEADLLTQARQYGEARKIAEANNAKVQLQTPEATAKEEAELLAQARAMGEERAKASKQFEKVKQSVLKDFDPNSNRSWQKTINKLSEYRKKYGDSANEDIMSFARDLESYSKGIEGTEVEKVLGPRRTVNVTERPRKFNGDMRTSEDFARNSTYIAEPLQREGMREAIGEDLYNRLEKSYVNWMDEYFRMDKTAGAANELELRAKYLEDTLDDVAKVTGDDFSNIKNAIRQNNELAIADNYGTTKFVTDYKGDHAGTKAKEPGYQFSDLTEEESELVDRSLRSARSAVGELDNRVREIQNRYNDWTKSGYGGNTYNPVSDTLAAQLDELKSSYNIYADAIADPAHEGLGYAKRALIRDLEKTRKLVNEEGKFNVNFGKQLTMDINGAEKAIYGHNIGNLSDAVKEETTLPIRTGNNADRLATDVKSFANRTELKKPSTVAETKETVPTLTAKPQKEEKPSVEDLTVKPGPKAKVKGKLPDELNKGSDNAKKAIKEKLAPEGDFKEYSVSKDIRTDKISTAPEVKAMFADQPQMYKVVHNKDIDAEAEKLFKESNSLEDARSICEGLASEHDATAIPLAKRLIDEYASKGEYQAAADVYDMLESKGNISGRFIQAFNMLMLKDNPIVAQKRLEKSIAKINLDGAKKFGKKWKDLSLTDDELAAFKQIKKGDREALGKLYDEIGERFGQEYPATLTEKILEYRRLAMLSGTTTHIRNFLANPPTMVLRHFADRYEALGQNIAHLINPDVKVTQSKLLPRHKDYALARQIRRESPIAKELFGNDTTGKYEVDELRNALIKNRTIYKGFHVKPGSKLEGTAFDTILKKKSELLNKANKKLYGKQGESVGELARNTIYGLLSKEDAPMVKANFDDRLASYIKAQNITSAQDIPEDAIALAWQEAMMATYKDDSWAVKALEGVRNGMKKIPVLGEPLAQTAIPFVQAPANITARVLDYSPLGGTAGMGRIIKGVRSNNVDMVSKGISQLAKGMSGTSAIALGTILAKSGIVTGAYSENKRMREAQQQSGWQEFSFKIGDKYYPYDWAQPWAQSVMMGVILNDTVNDLESYDSELLKALGVEGSAAGKAIGAVSKGGFEIANSVLEQSSVKGIRDLLASNQYGSNAEMAQGIAKQMGTNFAGSFIPTEVSKIAKTVDPLKRNANDKTNAYKAFGKAQQAKIPELSKKLPIKYDTWGRPQKYGEGKLDTFLNQNIYPGVPSKDRKTPVEEMTFELFNKTNDENVFAKLAPTKVDGKVLNNVQVSNIQKEMGQTSYKMADLLRNNGTFKSLKDSSKVEALNSAYGFAQMLAEKKILNRAITTNHNTAYKVYEEAGGGEAGLHAVVNLYAENEVLREAGVTANEKNRELYRKEGINAVKKLGVQSTAIENAGFEATEANRKLFEKGGKKALQDKQAYEDALERTGWKEKKKSSEEEEKENKKRTIYNERGEEGLSIYKSVDNAVDKRNKDTTQAAEAALNYLDKQKMSKADKGYYIAKSMGKPGKAAEAYIKKGDYEGLYEYEHHKYSADADGNNRLTKQEVEEYLNGQNMTNQQRLVWFDQLMPKSKKNPYK